MLLSIHATSYRGRSHILSCIYLWVLAVGGCAAIERPERAWFVSQLLRIILILEIGTLIHLRRLSETSGLA